MEYLNDVFLKTVADAIGRKFLGTNPEPIMRDQIVLIHKSSIMEIIKQHEKRKLTPTEIAEEIKNRITTLCG